MARPTKFEPLIARRIVAQAAIGLNNATAAEATGLSPRCLQDWLSRGRRGEAPFDGFAKEFDDAAEKSRRARLAARYQRDLAKGKARWKAFKAGREPWWIGRLGPVEFWARRLAWCEAHGKDRGAARARGELVAAIEVERGRVEAERRRREAAGVSA